MPEFDNLIHILQEIKKIIDVLGGELRRVFLPRARNAEWCSLYVSKDFLVKGFVHGFLVYRITGRGPFVPMRARKRGPRAIIWAYRDRWLGTHFGILKRKSVTSPYQSINVAVLFLPRTTMLLTETNVFRNTYWTSEPLATGTWPDLPSEALGSDLSLFVAAMHHLDNLACPEADDGTTDLDVYEVRHHLGLEVPPEITQSFGDTLTNYTTAKELVWIYLIHFKVLDLLLTPARPRTNPRTFEISACPRIGGSAHKLLTKLGNWPTALKELVAILDASALPAVPYSSVPPQPLNVTPESLPAILNYDKSKAQAHMTASENNIQAAAAGLLWVLELGSNPVPVIRNGGLTLVPFAEDSKRLAALGQCGGMLRSLSYLLFFSPIVLILSMDLSHTHIDFSAQLQIQHYLATTSCTASALPYVEHGLIDILRDMGARGLSAHQVVHTVIPPLVPGFQGKVPVLCGGDTKRFKGMELPSIYLPTEMSTDLAALYKTKTPRAAAAAIAPPNPPPTTVAAAADPPTQPPEATEAASVIIPRYYIAGLRSLSSAELPSGHIARALSTGPQFHTPAFFPDEDKPMRLISELPEFSFPPPPPSMGRQFGTVSVSGPSENGQYPLATKFEDRSRSRSREPPPFSPARTDSDVRDLTSTPPTPKPFSWTEEDIVVSAPAKPPASTPELPAASGSKTAPQGSLEGEAPRKVVPSPPTPSTPAVTKPPPASASPPNPSTPAAGTATPSTSAPDKPEEESASSGSVPEEQSKTATVPATGGKKTPSPSNPSVVTAPTTLQDEPPASSAPNPNPPANAGLETPPTSAPAKPPASTPELPAASGSKTAPQGSLEGEAPRKAAPSPPTPSTPAVTKPPPASASENPRESTPPNPSTTATATKDPPVSAPGKPQASTPPNPSTPAAGTETPSTSAPDKPEEESASSGSVPEEQSKTATVPATGGKKTPLAKGSASNGDDMDIDAPDIVTEQFVRRSTRDDDGITEEAAESEEELSPLPEEENVRYLADIDWSTIKKHSESIYVTGQQPDGKLTKFEYTGHEQSWETEYRIIEEVNKSIELRKLGEKYDPSLEYFFLEDLFPEPNPLLLAAWERGCDLYIAGAVPGPVIEDMVEFRQRLTIEHRLDQLFDIQGIATSTQSAPGSLDIVQGKRRFAGDDPDAQIDYTESIYFGTLEEMLRHAEDPDGPVLNALKLPAGNFPANNPLWGSGFDLEQVAYVQTSNLDGLPEIHPPYRELSFKLASVRNAFSPWHIDVAATWIFNYMKRQLSHPAEVFFLTNRRIQQPGRRHAVIGTGSEAATMTMGGYFFSAARIRPAMGVTLNCAMLPHQLTNADHVGLWQIYIRIAYFWLHTTSRTPEQEEKEAGLLLEKVYTCTRKSGETVRWESEIFSDCLVNMAVVLYQFHQRTMDTEPQAAIFEHFTLDNFHDNLRSALASYSQSVLKSVEKSILGSERIDFFLYTGDEFTVTLK
ncbi:hypothetical protein B0H12DRAFT_1082750 [Mycena haematopus]|nr:hypothetical protein B0H12DRAFT_1082750 [Mycena haematopus]